MANTAVEVDTVKRPVKVPPGSVRVEDADEEVFLLYTRLAAKPVADGSAPFDGLGYVDSRSNTMTVRFELKPTTPSPARTPKRRKGMKRAATEKQVVVEVELIQDVTALRSRKGDTGSVLWRLSVQLAHMLLLQYHFDIDSALFNCNWLSNAHVLELGAGTGLLSIALSPLVRQYTVTDIADLVPLIRKNLALNTPSPRSSNVTAEELDWVQFESTSPDLRSKFFSCPIVDLLLVVDCVYHPSLLPPLIETINHLTTRGKTIVLIAVELRSEEVIREFLDLLIRSDESWEIWSVGEHLLDMSYAIWTLWKGKIDSIVD